MHNKRPQSSEMFTVQEAATLFNVHPVTIRRWAYQSKLKGRKIGFRGDWRFTREELRELERPNSSMVVASTIARSSKPEHIVQFYDNDLFLLERVKSFIEASEAAIVIATPAHRDILEANLRIAGLSVEEAKQQGIYTALDAEETLSLFMDRDMPNERKFMRVIGDVVDRAKSKGDKVHAFGEMVALLWAKGNPEGAIRLEELWNELQAKKDFGLFCAYPMNSFADETHMQKFSAVCKNHSIVTPNESYSTLRTEPERLREIALLQQKARSLEAEVKKSKMLEQQKDDFLAVASHELKTPVTSIKVYGQVLGQHLSKGDDREAIEISQKIDMQVNKLTRLIEDLLDVTKMRIGRIEYNNSFFDGNELIRGVVDDMRFVSSGHVIQTQLGESVELYADRERMAQVLTNLLSNAIKYSPLANTILVTSDRTDENFTIHVRDFGIGIAKSEQEKVFGRFYRVPGEELDTFPGLGLGLHISNEIVRRQNGKIWVDSNYGEGSVFSFSLPITSDTQGDLSIAHSDVASGA